MHLTPSTVLLVSGCSLLLAACEQLGIETPAKIEAVRDAEGRAIGGACRHSGRALEDCYKLNAKASKAAIYAGWRDMDVYMRENNIAIVPSGNAPAKMAPAVEGTPTEAAPRSGAKPSAVDPPAWAPTQNRKST